LRLSRLCRLRLGSGLRALNFQIGNSQSSPLSLFGKSGLQFSELELIFGLSHSFSIYIFRAHQSCGQINVQQIEVGIAGLSICGEDFRI
jgi:hypothetical protein